jgi:hypothetical protein
VLVEAINYNTVMKLHQQDEVYHDVRAHVYFPALPGTALSKPYEYLRCPSLDPDVFGTSIWILDGMGIPALAGIRFFEGAAQCLFGGLNPLDTAILQAGRIHRHTIQCVSRRAGATPKVDGGSKFKAGTSEG